MFFCILPPPKHSSLAVDSLPLNREWTTLTRRIWTVNLSHIHGNSTHSIPSFCFRISCVCFMKIEFVLSLKRKFYFFFCFSHCRTKKVFFMCCCGSRLEIECMTSTETFPYGWHNFFLLFYYHGMKKSHSRRCLKFFLINKIMSTVNALFKRWIKLNFHPILEDAKQRKKNYADLCVW